MEGGDVGCDVGEEVAEGRGVRDGGVGAFAEVGPGGEGEGEGVGGGRRHWWWGFWGSGVDGEGGGREKVTGDGGWGEMVGL